MRLHDITTPRARRINEVHWTDLYPKSFQDFRKKYLPLLRHRQASSLYIQFSNFADNTMDRTAYTNPDHHDPVGVYAYPIGYVLKHPADVWYGQGARYMRVLRDTSKQRVNLAYLNSEGAVERALREMGFDWNEINTMLPLAKKHFRDRIKGTNRYGKLFLSCVQIDLLSPPIGQKKRGMFDRGGPEFRIRTGAEQTALFRKWGVDAIEDTARTNKSAIINDREPEQIIFLTRNAFRVVEVFSLRAGIPTQQLPSMTFTDPSQTRIERPLAAALAKAMDDQITQSARDPKVRELLDASYQYYWTAKGRRIKIEFDRPASYYQNKTMGEKKHRESGLSDPHVTRIEIKTELGDITRQFGSDAEFREVIGFVLRQWRELQTNPQQTDWTPQNATSFMQVVKAQKDAATQKLIDDARRKRLEEWPQVLEAIQWLAAHFNLPFRAPDDDEAISIFVESMGYFSNRIRRDTEGFAETLAEWPDVVMLFSDGPKIKHLQPMILAAVEDLSAIYRAGAEVASPRYWARFGDDSPLFLRKELQTREADRG